MTPDVKAGASAALYAELLAAAGPERTLTLIALRRLLVGADKEALVEVLGRAAQEGVTLPGSVTDLFGIPVGGPVAPSRPDHPTPVPTPNKAPTAVGRLPAVPVQKTPGPRFSIALTPDSRLDLTALTIRTLCPEATSAAPPTPKPATARFRFPTVPAKASPPSADMLACPSALCSDPPHTHRKVNFMGQIRVDGQTIGTLAELSGKIVTVLLEDRWFRVLHEGREIAVTPRRHRIEVGRYHGNPR
ncbi:hypothetical protein ACIA6T_30015 [Streptomyces sp. NPDC051740]|uniref:hypothetical protein n=1 Tax=Streptomyces sp. NPDC051740 TaxID=3365673 RepID=UPI0037B417BE